MKATSLMIIASLAADRTTIIKIVEVNKKAFGTCVSKLKKAKDITLTKNKKNEKYKQNRKDHDHVGVL